MKSIRPYRGKTYVAFIDISGFKEYMKSRKKARSALNKFYNTLHQIGNLFELRNNNEGGVRVNVLAVSDCAIVFSRNYYSMDKINGLLSILNFIRFFNRKMVNREIPPRILTTCSISFGDFHFEKRSVNEVIDKQFFFGDGYLNSYLDHVITKPKLDVGECRIDKKSISNLYHDYINIDPIKLLIEYQNHYYFYWMLKDINLLENFKNEYYFDSKKNTAYYERKKDILHKYCYD